MDRVRYQHDGARIHSSREIEAHAGLGQEMFSVTFMAKNIRQERTGVHARIDVAINGVTLAYSFFNVERDEERVRLANSGFRAYKEEAGLVREYPASVLKKDLDDFCDGLWDEQVAGSVGTYSFGSEERLPPSYLLRPYIMAGAGTIVQGPPGMGKSYALALMAVSLDAGLSTLWPVETAKRALFINLERPKRTYEDRLGNINAALGLERKRPLLMLHARGRGLLDVQEGIRRTIQEHDVGAIFVDSISRAGMGDLNDNETANKIVDVLNAFGPAWVGIGHPPRKDATHIYGSVHFEAGADMTVRLHSQQKNDGPLGIGLEITKKNDIPNFPLMQFAVEFDERGLTRVRRSRPAEFPEVERGGGHRVTMESEVRDWLLDHGKATATDAAKATGYSRQNVSALLANNEHFVSLGKEGRETHYGVRG